VESLGEPLGGDASRAGGLRVGEAADVDEPEGVGLVGGKAVRGVAHGGVERLVSDGAGGRWGGAAAPRDRGAGPRGGLEPAGVEQTADVDEAEMAELGLIA